MAIITRSPEDIIIDNMVTILREFGDEQSALDNKLGFTVARDMFRPPSQSKVPIVNVWLESITPQNGSKSYT